MSPGRAASAWRDIQERVRRACERSGRDPSEVHVLGACKRQPADRLRAAYDAGLRDFAENQVQSGEANRPLLPPDVRWHFIGPLQSNKVKRAAAIFDTFHAVDRLKIARALDRHCTDRARPAACFLEVNLGAEESKHGFLEAELADAAREVATFEHVQLAGLMAIPPRSETEAEARAWFQRLRELLHRLQDTWETPDPPRFLSMGMSGDYEVAIEEGATHVRIGTALFGARD